MEQSEQLVSVRLDPAVREAVGALAQELGQSRSDVLRYLLDLGLTAHGQVGAQAIERIKAIAQIQAEEQAAAQERIATRLKELQSPPQEDETHV